MTTMTGEIAEEDLNEVRFLARQVRGAEERVDSLLMQAHATDDEAGQGVGPRVLLASAGEGTLEFLLSKWLGDEFAEALRQVGLKPLVLGPEPERVRPRTGLG